ncbi:hypothetical protein J7T55_005720 [Diaporthe amygdali]|uniref:uncharacterized protein n=1 Tax=Phomopsis amygdali TaxID=1214568 RepID=UPI0022FE80F2|nr:uncharacterized protein J7T55_005720 [Diaporthe amygdali]KAJ0124382.1 hypothetical protein J7T55_005720 [Diaporthe amygdali]
MTDKRSPQSPAHRSQKRSKTFPLAPNEENISTPCRRATAPLIENEATAEANSPSKQKGTENEVATPDEEQLESPKDSPLRASPPNDHPDADPESTRLSDFDTFAADRDAEDKPSEQEGDDPLVPEGKESDGISDAYCDPDYDDESDIGSPVVSEDLNEEFGRWVPPSEPLRPENPYRKGQTLEIRKHTASRPFGMNYPYHKGERKCASERELRQKTLVKLCLDRPPSEGETAAGEKAMTLEIMDEIRVKEDGGAQIVVCRFSEQQEPVIAKIYDPLYYGFADRMWSDQPRDVTYEAGKDYCREVAAYLELDNELGGTIVPKYHGSWTFQLPLDLPDGQRMRDIRLILMEYIDGRPMTDLKPEAFPESVGLELVTRIVEAVSRIQFVGVRHGDVSQRNVMVCLTEPDVIERVALIDFNFAVVTRLDNFEQQFRGLTREPKPEKPPNPIDRWWRGALYGMAGEWLPKSWEFRLRACQEWLYERYGTSEEYAPPKRSLKWDEENLPRNWIAT